MKIRAGFVANSSSSSYLIVGIDKEEYIELFARVQKLAFINYNEEFLLLNKEAEETYLSYGQYKCDEIIYVGNSGEPYIVGIDAEGLLEDNTLPQARILFQEKAKKLGIDIPLFEIDLHYGESNS